MKKALFLLLVAFFFVSELFAQVPVVTDPADLTVTEGETATFSITVTSGVTPYTYQWQVSFDQATFVNISGANSSSYTTSGANLSLDGSWYRCVVSNTSGSTNSNYAVLTVNLASPVITQHPTNQSIFIGQTATFNVTATGSGVLSYQWYANSTMIPGATNSSYTTSTIQNTSFDGTVFYCVISNGGGSTESDNATLSVSLPTERVTNGLLALYDFKDGAGSTVNDISGIGSPLNLSITDVSNTTWTAEGLILHGETSLKSSNVASKIINSCVATNEVTFEAWYLPSDTLQNGIKARIMTMAKDDKHIRNIGLFQDGGTYEFALRTTNTTSNGGETASYGYNQKLTHYVATRDLNSNVKIFIDGVLVEEGQITGDFSNWENDFFLHLGSDVDEQNSWQGTFYLSAFYSRALSDGEVTQNYSFGVVTDDLPLILINPNSQVVLNGQTATFNVEAIGAAPLSYQWKKNGANISGATNSTYTTPILNIGDNGAQYQCVVSSPDGSSESSTAFITILVTDERITQDIIAQYTFREGIGTIINDVSNVGSAINLNIQTPSAVNWTANGLEINSPANIFSAGAASKIYDLCTSTNMLTIEVWIKPANNTQSGPARIVTLSQDGNARNFTLGQEADKYEARLRTNVTNSNGLPALSTAAGTVTGELQHVVYEFRGDAQGAIFVNGVRLLKTPIGGDFSTWPSTYRLSIVNELIDQRPWLGTINYLAIFNRSLSTEEVLHNYNIGPYEIGALVDPTELTAVNSGIGVLNISWTDGNTSEDGFVLEKGSGDPINWSPIATLAKDVTSFTDENIDEGTRYSYRCKAINNFTNSSSNYSNISQVVSLMKKPTGLTAIAEVVGKIDLSWSDSSNGETGFKIERGSGNPIEFTIVGTVEANIVNYSDLTIEEGVEYSYRVNAFNSVITSEYSNIVGIRSKASFINAPTDLRAELHSVSGHPVLTWLDNAFNEAGYVVERSLTNVGADFVVLDTVGADITTITDQTVQDSTSYVYRVYGFNDQLVSDYSGTAFIGVWVDVETEQEIPTEFGLSQNYPNPFNPSTTISFNLPEASDITVKLYNALGQELYTLVNSHYGIGRYDINFNASDLTSGIYIYSIVATGVSGKQFVESKKLILLK